MKKLLTLIFILNISFITSAQSETIPEFEPYFSTIIVEDIDASINWFTGMLGFEVLNKIENEARGFKQSNLKKGNSLIELIELDKAVSQKDAITNYNSKTRVVGFFKIGFLVTEFDTLINRLDAKGVNFYGNIITEYTTGKKIAIILDPDGNRIQLFEK